MCNFYRFTAFAVVVATSVVAEAQENWQWARNLDEARAIAAQSNRLVLIHFGGKDCHPCQILERDVFAKPGFGRAMAANYVGVKVDAKLSPAMARDYKIELLPTDVVVTPDLEVIDKRVSPRSVADYAKVMGQIAADHRQRESAVATGYQRPVVSYGTVRSSGPATATAPASGASSYEGTQDAAAPPSYPQQQVAQAPAPSTARPAAKQDRYADYYEQTAQQPAAPPVDAYAGYQAPAMAPVMTPPAAPQDRYTDYANMQQATAPGQDFAPPAQNYAAPAAPNYTAATPPNYTVATPPSYTAANPPSYAAATPPSYTVPARSYAPPANTVQQPGPAPMQSAAAAANPAAPRSRAAVTQEQLPPGSAPLSLDGYCPVALSEQQRWLPGDVRYGAEHEGRTYLFSCEADQQKFMQQPHRYAPVMAGNDPVFATDNGQLLSGSREHGLFVDGRIYLFSSEESLAQFERNRERYVQSVNRTLR